MNVFPVFFDLAGRSVLLVGGGETALQKLRLLRKAGARLRLVAPELAPDLASALEEGGVEWRAEPLTPAHFAEATLAVIATGDEGRDRAGAAMAKEARVPVNVVDRADLSDFIVPAIVDRDPVVIGISTAGAAPLLARRLRATIEALLPARLGALARFAERFRGAVAAKIDHRQLRLRFWEQVFDGPVASAVLEGRESQAAERMLTLVNSAAANDPAEGRVALVGAGPGDPELLTLKAHRLLQEADVIVYDRLVAPAVLELARRDARRVAVGKARGAHSLPQAEINRLLASEARAGNRVVRLKGGDPFIFGRGGEELDHLEREGIAVEVVPGITAALGCAASARVALTHRDTAQAVIFATAEGAEGEPALDWSALAGPHCTLAIYMGIGAAPRLQQRLLEGGLDPATPVAVIENGTRADERVLTGRVDGLAARVARHEVSGPAIILIGEVAANAKAAALETAARPAERRRA
ncbi:MAG TPA: siroheme synthase CysG [Hypericibacter adhaerens]|uniref:siroheme synthase CysG n=1 Tax=Hypericibacter adhaerens TaxID=2602016 RepID=UPI002CBCD6D9|nr:siroheme synthase CysG [Hypericibacter adhaerens]HWA42982.1 siroheme synthase CysG [Hypericibacter adhaerens]